MSIRDLLATGRPSVSFEFFPPRSPDAAARLDAACAELAPLAPAFVSVTYGAGGSTRHLTVEAVGHLRATTPFETVPHLTAVGHSRGDVETLLGRYGELGVETIMALRGDPPRDGSTPSGDFRSAADLIAKIRAAGPFEIGAAAFPDGHPETPNRLREMDHLKAKVDAGVDYLCTQMVFDHDAFFDFVDRCRLAGIRVPILAGIMPVTSRAGLDRMAQLSGGTRFPARLLRALARWEGDPSAQREAGLDYSRAQCRELLAGGVDGLHFYTMNQAAPTLAICRALDRGVPARVAAGA